MTQAFLPVARVDVLGAAGTDKNVCLTFLRAITEPEICASMVEAVKAHTGAVDGQADFGTLIGVLPFIEVGAGL